MSGCIGGCPGIIMLPERANYILSLRDTNDKCGHNHLYTSIRCLQVVIAQPFGLVDDLIDLYVHLACSQGPFQYIPLPVPYDGSAYRRKDGNGLSYQLSIVQLTCRLP